MRLPMKLMIGGYAQGKLSYVLLKYQLSEDAVWDSVLPEETELRRKQRMHCVEHGVLPDQTAASVEPIVVNHFHQWGKAQAVGRGMPGEGRAVVFEPL